MNIKFSARGLATALLAMLLTAGLCGRANADTAISACGTLGTAGNYFLTTNLTASGDCLVIGAANVAIDLKGKTITGNGTGAAITDDGAVRNFAIIANGKIRNFETGIDLSDSGLAVISNIDSSNNTGEGIFIQRCCNTLSSVKANNNGSTGIDIDSDDSNLSKIQANGNGDGGIFISSCCNTLNDSTVTGNSGRGVEMHGCCSFLIASKIQNNSGDGTELTSCCNGVIGSTVAGNGGTGANLPNNDNMVAASKLNSNGGTGIDIGGRWGIISNAQAKKNAGGVEMECRGSVSKLTATGNAGANLTQTDVDGPCANVNVNAP